MDDQLRRRLFEMLERDTKARQLAAIGGGLFEGYNEKLRDVLGKEFAVGMPNRDFFVALSTEAPDMVRHVRERVREDFSQMDHPLTDKLLLVSQDGVSELP